MTDRTKCKRVTKKGTPCPYTAITGSEFCRRHQPREIWIPLLFSIVLNILLFIVSVAISLYCYGESKSWRHISRPRVIPAVGGFPVVIDDGLNVIINKPGFVTHKMEEGPFDYRIDDDGAIKVYGEIRRSDGTLIVEATGDNIRVLPNTGLDINSDSRACEIVDSDKNPIYQISVVFFDQWKKDTDKASQENLDSLLSLANEVIEMSYIHRTGDSWWCVTPEGSQLVHNHKNMKEWQSKIPRLFRYPGKKYPGMRLNNQTP